MNKLAQLKQWDMVYFKAVDHTTSEQNGWAPLAEAVEEAPCLIEGVGYVLSSDKEVLRLANSHVEHKDVATIWCVPVGCIQELRLLKPTKKNYA
jgi:hypothetical protein